MAESKVECWLISGRVQGVGYRAWMVEQARLLGVDGRVRNLADGRVEAVLLGDAELLARLRQACERGPRHAGVEAVVVRPVAQSPVAPGGGFHQADDGA